MPGTLKARYNVRGAMMYPGLCKSLGVPYRNCGALVVALYSGDISTLEVLLERGRQNGVTGLRIVRQPELHKMEPGLNPDAEAALEVPSSAIVSPYEMAFAMADDAAVNGVQFLMDEPVLSVSGPDNGRWTVVTGSRTVSCHALINCAGSGGAVVHNMYSHEKLTMIHRRGQYYLLDRLADLPFSRTVFQCPNRMGKGVLVSPTVHGNLIIGPNAEDIPDACDTATTGNGLAEVLQKAALTWPEISTRNNITNFSGIRAHLPSDDFRVGPAAGCSGIFEAIGIESPGLSSAPAIAADLAIQVAGYLHLKKKTTVVPLPPREIPFHDMTEDMRRAAVTANPLYGNIICRCETVTEAEIRAAIHRPAGARTVDGVKRRTRAGMGRCQGGFCSPRVASILAEELNISPGEVTKDGGKSTMLAGTVSDFLKAGESDD